ncbi:hypothetical protein RRG08_048723 [Elysia crispata]|uniref:Uncharacterized protein n=1 Tax=Elysia crispata TaxID=231223 RepID=A0AAE1B8A9_9GAST|nr:hypothetical protein RRG08_048723 [Elysia crispata]
MGESIATFGGVPDQPQGPRSTRGSSHRARCPERSQAELDDRAAAKSHPPSLVSGAAGTGTLKSACTAIRLHLCKMLQGLALSNRPAQPLQAAHVDSSWSYTILSTRREDAKYDDEFSLRS